MIRSNAYELPAIEEGVIAQLTIDLIPDDFGKTGGYRNLGRKPHPLAGGDECHSYSF